MIATLDAGILIIIGYPATHIRVEGKLHGTALISGNGAEYRRFFAAGGYRLAPVFLASQAAGASRRACTAGAETGACK